MVMAAAMATAVERGKDGRIDDSGINKGSTADGDGVEFGNGADSTAFELGSRTGSAEDGRGVPGSAVLEVFMLLEAVVEAAEDGVG
jgi:hypothetical protein